MINREQQASACYIVLSRAYLELSSQGKISPLDDRSWGYRDESHTLGYDPQSDSLWISDRSGNRMEWREGLWINPTEAISPDFLKDIADLDARLDALGTPVNASLGEAQAQAQTHADLALFNEPSTQNLQTAARLFEQYAEAGQTAYQIEGSTAHHYRIEANGQNYVISRDETNRYRLSREDGLWTDQDAAAWQTLDQWVTAQGKQFEELQDKTAISYWEQQQDWAQQMLPVALHLAEQESERDGIRAFQWQNFNVVLDRKQNTMEVSRQDVPLFQVEQWSSEPKISLTGHLTSDRWREFLPLLTWNQVAGGQQALQQEWNRMISNPDRSSAPERD